MVYYPAIADATRVKQRADAQRRELRRGDFGSVVLDDEKILNGSELSILSSLLIRCRRGSRYDNHGIRNHRLRLERTV